MSPNDWNALLGVILMLLALVTLFELMVIRSLIHRADRWLAGAGVVIMSASGAYLFYLAVQGWSV